MSSVLNKDQITYNKEKESFLKELRQFHETRGTPFRNGPKISGHFVDLYLLYALVTELGGWVKVNSRNEWDKILEDLKLPRSCVNCSVAIKQVYLRYLDRYEKVNFLGEVGDRVSEDDEDSRHKKWSMRSLHSVPLNYNHTQHNVNESLRENNGLSIDLYRASEYDKLGMSLLSPLINEQDFAINVCTLLSNEGKHCLKLEKHPRILHYLLAHAAVFSHSSLSTLFCDHYSKVRGHSFSRFWQDILCDSNLIRLIDESQFEENDYEDICADDEPLAALPENKCGLTFQPEDKELFCLGRTLGTQDYVGQRVLQVATILRNLSFIQENLNVMNRDLTFLRFVLLCCGSQWNSLHQMGWDMLGNLASDITVLCPLMPEILGVTLQGLESSDRAEIISSLEVLNKISQNVKNEEYLLKYLEKKVYERICSFFTIHDIMLLICALECIFSLSSLGEKACNSILKVQGIVETLVSLITVDSQSYSSKAYIQMKVVETVTSITGDSIHEEGTTITTVPVSTGTNTLRPSTPTSVTAVPTIHIQPITTVSPAPSTIPQLISSTQTIVQIPPPAQPQPQAPSRVIVSENSSSTQAPLATQQIAQENELFAFAWLKTTFELSSGSCIEQQELYKQYINYCSKIGRRGVIAPLHFPRCVRSVFGVNVVTTASNGGDICQQFYEGIQVRAKPLVSPNPIAPLPQSPSPILKAQLSAPPKSTSPSPQQNKEAAGGSTPSADQGTTSLIKSLLATKVTQRQQQQKLLQKTSDNVQTSDDSSSVTSTPLTVSTGTNISIIEKLPVNSNTCSNQIYHNKSTTTKLNGIQPNVLETSAVKKENKTVTDSVITTSVGIPSGQNLPILSLNSSNNGIKINLQNNDHEYAENLPAKKIKVCSTSSECSSDDVMHSEGNELKEKESTIPISKNIMLTDLLDKNIVKNEPTSLNGSLCFADKGLELIHDSGSWTISIPEPPDVPLLMDSSLTTLKEDKHTLKRTKDLSENTDAKKPRLIGNTTKEEPPEEVNVSSSAANLYAALAADALEDEPVDEIPETSVIVTASNEPRQILVTTGAQLAQRVVVNGQHYVVTQPQNALLQGHTQTVLVAQTAQHHCSGAKTIIILQPQNMSSTNNQQKVLVQNFQSNPPPLISSSQVPVIRPKSPPKAPSTPPLPQQWLIQQNLSKPLPNIISNQNTSSVQSLVNTNSINFPNTSSVITLSSTLSSSTSTSPLKHVITSENILSSKRVDKGNFICEWRGCMRSFKTSNEVYMHACEVHCPQGSQEIQCLWERCDSMKRKRFSHMTHLYDRHCNTDIMRIMAVRRKQLSLTNRAEASNQTTPFPHPGYAPNAALHAIKRHALDFVNAKELQDDSESPVTKSVRLTSALILRNLVIFSTNGRRHLSRFEPHLANVALSSVESSRTLAQVLYDMGQQS